MDILFFDKTDGLVAGETAWGFQPSVWRDSRDRLWFSTIKGVGMVDPSELRISETTFAPRVTSSGYVDREGVSRDLPVSEEGVDVPPGGGSMEFKFTAPNFSAPSRVGFEHALFRGGSLVEEGHGHDRELRYAWLPPGDYRLEIRASNHHGVEHPEPVSLA